MPDSPMMNSFRETNFNDRYGTQNSQFQNMQSGQNNQNRQNKESHHQQQQQEHGQQTQQHDFSQQQHLPQTLPPRRGSGRDEGPYGFSGDDVAEENERLKSVIREVRHVQLFCLSSCPGPNRMFLIDPGTSFSRTLFANICLLERRYFKYSDNFVGFCGLSGFYDISGTI